ncbi:HipA N-terminal domain-containing protein [Oribacterium sp. Sow4_G1_1]|uniref:HipA N-terminal domain-containing protein n=1 Tax=Oribacterium sp. Sow4_G1_1 TaxID=3438794 RepID=UPI003F9CF7D4
MEETFRKAYVYVRDTYAGVLSETDSGYTFSYDRAYMLRADATAVSLTLPLREEPYRSSTLFSFFDGLIPEGWLLNVISRNWKLLPTDRFGLLLKACKDPIGNVSIMEARV